jgi:cation diffusion facilitator family transporter
MPALPLSSSDGTKQRIAAWSLAAAVGLLVFKLLVGLHANSLGILAEAAHSALDLLASTLTWISLRIAARPADANHPFGHGKFESFSALLEAGLLLVTAFGIGDAAVHRWLAGTGAAMRLDAWAFAVMATSMAVDAVRARFLLRASRTYSSDALAADAVNYSSDIATSAAVLLGLALVGVGRRFNLPWLQHADAAAALVVAAAMIWLALRLGRKVAGVLLDEAPAGLSRELLETVQAVEGVTQVERLRVRRMGSRYFVDVQLCLEPASTLEHAGQVRRDVASRIHRRLPEADVVVEARPGEQPHMGPIERVQAVAQRHNLTIHDLTVYQIGGGLDVEFHLEFSESMPLAEAHDLVSRLEAEIRHEVSGVREIVTHIEPESAEVGAAALVDAQDIAQQVRTLAGNAPGLLDCHAIQVRSSNGHLTMSCHCSFSDTLPVSDVHERVSRLEAEIRRALPQLFRITIHPEPRSDNRR